MHGLFKMFVSIRAWVISSANKTSMITTFLFLLCFIPQCDHPSTFTHNVQLVRSLCFKDPCFIFIKTQATKSTANLIIQQCILPRCRHGCSCLTMSFVHPRMRCKGHPWELPIMAITTQPVAEQPFVHSAFPVHLTPDPHRYVSICSPLQQIARRSNKQQKRAQQLIIYTQQPASCDGSFRSKPFNGIFWIGCIVIF